MIYAITQDYRVVPFGLFSKSPQGTLETHSTWYDAFRRAKYLRSEGVKTRPQAAHRQASQQEGE